MTCPTCGQPKPEEWRYKRYFDLPEQWNDYEKTAKAIGLPVEASREFCGAILLRYECQAYR